MAKKSGKDGLKSFGIAGLVGIVSDIIMPSTGIAIKALGSLAYSTIVAPLSYKISHPEASLNDSYRNTLPRATGYLGGSYIPTLLRYVT